MARRQRSRRCRCRLGFRVRGRGMGMDDSERLARFEAVLAALLALFLHWMTKSLVLPSAVFCVLEGGLAAVYFLKPRGWRVCSRSFSTAWRCSAGSTILSTACSIFLPWCILFPWRCCLCSSPARGLKNAAGREKGGANDAGQQTTPGK